MIVKTCAFVSNKKGFEYVEVGFPICRSSICRLFNYCNTFRGWKKTVFENKKTVTSKSIATVQICFKVRIIKCVIKLQTLL